MHKIVPDWPAPKGIMAMTMGRQEGHSAGKYASFNCADHVGDRPEDVNHNRTLLMSALQLNTQPFWLQQVHGNDVVEARPGQASSPEADGSHTHQKNQALAILTADCLPILLCDQSGQWIAAIHAGWKGLANGIIDKICQQHPQPSDLMAWIGPGICSDCYRIEPQRAQTFSTDMQKACITQQGEYTHMNLAACAQFQLQHHGITAIYTSTQCTYESTESLYSYRRDGITGRQVSLIWIQS